MDITLHLGAHRTASTSFQRYMQAAAPRLVAQGVGYWGPMRTRKGMFHGILDTGTERRSADRGAGRIALNLCGMQARGATHLIVSDENMIGTPRNNLRHTSLYPGIGARMARFHAGFGGQITRVVLQIRSLDMYWASLIAYAVPRGARVPSVMQLSAMAQGPRGWRDVITELADALPGARIIVTPFERFATRPDHVLGLMGDVTPPAPHTNIWVNRSPDLGQLRVALADRGSDVILPVGDGRWQPFAPPHVALMRARHAADLGWLRGGAAGLATYTEEPEPHTEARPEHLTRGHSHEFERGMAQAR